MLSAMHGQDSLTVLPTGGGKSLCYQAPAVSRDGMAVVVSPLIALMKDQVDALTACGIEAACVNSSLSPAERQEVAARVRAGQIKLLFVAPERLVQARTIDFLKQSTVSFFAIDEAHCISNWGHDFRPEYRRLAMLREAFPETSIHAFTATATEQVRDDIARQLCLHEPKILVGSFDRPNLTFRIKRREDAIGQMREVIDRHPNESGIVYCISRANVESTAEALQECGYKALPYHAGLEGEQRASHQEQFLDEEVDIIVATVAFGMGIDKSNVRYVIHGEMPRSIEAYQQETGRAGRDGLEAECCLLFSGRDVATWEFLINQSENDENREASLKALRQMESFCSNPVCRHKTLVAHFGQQLESDNCSACDVCLSEVKTLDDSLTVAQKILSSVYRQEQRFGAEYTTLVLRGSRSQKVLRNKHEQLSTWGLLKEESDQVVRSWIDQLLAQGFLKRAGEHSVLQLTEDGIAVLKGERTPKLCRSGRSTRSADYDQWQGVDRGLFEHLRQVRMNIAKERGVPPYVIFSDMTLRELAKLRPTGEDGLLQVYGIGEQKRTAFGKPFLDAVREYCAENSLDTDVAAGGGPSGTQAAKSVGSRRRSTTSRLSAANEVYFEQFDQGLSRDEVALQLDRAISTVTGYLVKYIQARQIDDASTFLPADTVQRVLEVLPEVEDLRLKPIFEALDGTVTYDDIRIVVTCVKVAHADPTATEEG
jgi:ATP-dependent DNA helicase RecQ